MYKLNYNFDYFFIDTLNRNFKTRCKNKISEIKLNRTISNLNFAKND